MASILLVIIGNDRISGRSDNLLVLVVLFLLYAAETCVSLGEFREMNATLLSVLAELHGGVLLGEGEVGGIGRASVAGVGVIETQETDDIGEDGGVTILAPHEAEMLEVLLLAHINGVKVIKKRLEVGQSIGASIEERNGASHIRQVIRRCAVRAIGGTASILGIIVHLEATRLLDLEPVGDDLDGRVGVNMIVQSSALRREQILGGPAEKELVGLVHEPSKERLGQNTAPEECSRQEGFATENQENDLGLHVDHGIHNTMVETAHSGSGSKRDEDVDLGGQGRVAREATKTLSGSLRESNVAQLLSLSYLQCILDTGGNVIGNEIIDTEVPILGLVGSVLAMLVRVSVSAIVS